ncbi:MAG: GuaB3 family IMP dehydrogenase-related protein [Chloroflexota bacterium]
MASPKFKELAPAYGFDEVALVPGDITVNPEQTDISFSIADRRFAIPVLAAAMDGVVDPKFALLFGKCGGLAVMNLEGVQSRYSDADGVLNEIANAPAADVTALMQRVYSAPIKEELIGKRIKQIKKSGVICAVSITPTNAKKLAPIAKEAGVDILVIQSTVTTARHISKSYRGLIFSEFKRAMNMPVVVGNTVSFSAAMELMREGIDGLLVGVGPGAACTTREVLGVGVPQVTATMDSSAARDAYFKESGRYVPIITDGGMKNGGDICKAIGAGADAIMLGSIFAGAKEAPGRGYHWGMANPHASLPRGTRVKVASGAPLERILFGPSSKTDGTENLIGALRTSMGVCSARNIKEMHKVKMVIAPSIKTEGKHFQMVQYAR